MHSIIFASPNFLLPGDVIFKGTLKYSVPMQANSNVGFGIYKGTMYSIRFLINYFFLAQCVCHGRCVDMRGQLGNWFLFFNSLGPVNWMSALVADASTCSAIFLPLVYWFFCLAEFHSVCADTDRVVFFQCTFCLKF